MPCQTLTLSGERNLYLFTITWSALCNGFRCEDRDSQLHDTAEVLSAGTAFAENDASTSRHWSTPVSVMTRVPRYGGSWFAFV